MIGYNVQKIEELAITLADNYKSIGEKMSEGWSTLSTTMETEWVGPDEVSYEKELATNICNLYASCQQTVEQMINNIKILGTNWKNFQTSNVLEGADTTMGSDSIFGQDICVPNVTSYTYDIGSIVKAGSPQFTTSTNLGLTNGTQSGITIKTQFDTYIDGVYTSVKNLFSGLDTSTAFLGSELSSKVSDYLQNMADSLAKLTTCHKSIYDALDALINRYATHESEEAGSVSESNTSGIDFQGQNLK